MLEANKTIWFEKIFAIYNRNLLKRRFYKCRVKELQKLRERNLEIPLIIYINHSSWWDGLVLFEVLKKPEFDNFLMMEEKQLKSLRLFRRLGAFSVIRENPREAVRSLNYAVSILREKPRRTLLIFPQGEILPNEIRPLKFYNGISRIIQKLGSCMVVPCSLRYEFLKNYKPEIFVKFGVAENIVIDKNFDPKYFTKILAEKLTTNLDCLKTDIINNDLKDYSSIF